MHGTVLVDALVTGWKFGMTFWMYLTAWMLTSWMLTTSTCGRGHFVNEEGYVFIFSGPTTAPADTQRPRVPTVLIEICRLVGVDHEMEVRSPQNMYGFRT